MASRSVVSVLVRFVGRSFSTNSRPARQRHDGHRGAGLTLKTRGEPEQRRVVPAWSAPGPRWVREGSRRWVRIPPPPPQPPALSLSFTTAGPR
jgi:hypothetical protein